MKLTVYFSNGSVHTFEGFWKNVLKEIDAYCTRHNVITIDSSWN